MAAFLGYTVPERYDDEVEDEPTRVVRKIELVGTDTMIIDDGVELEDVRGAISSAYDAVPVPEPDRGWGPRGPLELKTTIWDRDGASEEIEATRAVETHTITPKPRDIITSTGVRTKRPKSGRGALLAGLCGAAGVILGSAVGLAANESPRAAATTLTVPQTVAAPAPAVAPEPIAAPVAVIAPSPVEVAPVPVAVEAPAPAAPSASELLTLCSDAIHDGDVEGAQDALARARAAGAEGLAVARVDAALAVLRGEGAPAVPRLRAFAEAHHEGALWVALGRVLDQAERDQEAAQAFGVALSLDPGDADAHLGLAAIEARAADVAAAQRHLRNAEEAVGTGEPDPQLRARLRVTAGLIHLERGRFAEATDEAMSARSLDPRSAEASLLLARIALTRGQEPLAHLRDAVAGRAPAPLALGLLAPRLRGAEACALASSYLERAPEGWDARAMRRIAQRCD